jgi:hypothetical protein
VGEDRRAHQNWNPWAATPRLETCHEHCEHRVNLPMRPAGSQDASALLPAATPRSRHDARCRAPHALAFWPRLLTDGSFTRQLARAHAHHDPTSRWNRVLKMKQLGLDVRQHHMTDHAEVAFVLIAYWPERDAGFLSVIAFVREGGCWLSGWRDAVSQIFNAVLFDCDGVLVNEPSPMACCARC